MAVKISVFDFQCLMCNRLRSMLLDTGQHLDIGQQLRNPEE
jgi:hypothetical protein